MQSNNSIQALRPAPGVSGHIEPKGDPILKACGDRMSFRGVDPSVVLSSGSLKAPKGSVGLYGGAMLFGSVLFVRFPFTIFLLILSTKTSWYSGWYSVCE